MSQCCVCNKNIISDLFFTPDEEHPSYIFCDSCYRALRELSQRPSETEYRQIDTLFSDFARNTHIPISVRNVYRNADDTYWENKDSAQKYQDLYNRAIDELLLTTGSHFEGYKVTKYLDIISCEIIFKNSFLNSLSANLDDFFTSLSFRERELSGSMEQIERAKKHVMAQFRKKAVSLGANAVLGIDFESTFGSDVVKISVNGTAVTVDKIE
ncbi:MAG: heavy metal-binding domain-containing protein [Oscillospiraceae bacterium]|nr:heavy metal-binding domain-containing protein [Oscillospiraceae bacterium]